MDEEVVGVCELLESLLGAEPGLACRLHGLVGRLSRHGPSLHLQAWLHRMFELSGGTDTSRSTEVSRHATEHQDPDLNQGLKVDDISS